MEDKVINQHYVPMLYLRNFSIKKGKEYYINCFDKFLSKKFPINIKKVASEDKFYDLPEDDQQIIEKGFLRRLEIDLGKTYHKLVESASLESLSDKEREDIALFVALQYLRTKEKREGFRDGTHQLKQFLSKHKLSEEFQGQIDNFDDEKDVKELHINLLFQLPRFAKIFLDKRWILFANQTGKPYWTSDNPITLHNDEKDKFRSNLGLTSSGIQIYFPLSPTLTLGLFDPQKFSWIPSKFNGSKKENITFQNHLQVKYSTRYVYSLDDDFELVEIMLKENPELGNPSRNRTKIN